MATFQTQVQITVQLTVNQSVLLRVEIIELNVIGDMQCTVHIM